jgi:lipopolysaccharide export system permease protein
MPGIQKYMYRQIVGPLLFSTFVLTGVIWLSQSLRLLDVVINQSQSVGTFMYLTLLALPQLMPLILPFAMFFAVLYALNRLYVESELVVMWAAGFSRWVVVWPILVIAVAVAAVGYFFNLVAMPAGMREMKSRVFEIRADLVNTFVREGSFTNPIKGLTVYVSENNAGGDIRGILVHDARNPKGIATYMAQRGLLANTPTGARLIMQQGNVQWLEGGGGRLKILNFERYTFDLSQFDKAQGTRIPEVSERWLGELFNPKEVLPEKQRQKLLAEAHNRLSGPLYAIVFALIATYALIGGNFNRKGYAGRMGLAFLAMFAARIPGFLFQQWTASKPDMAFTLYLWPGLWIAILLFMLAYPRFELLRRGKMAASPVAEGAR